MPAARYDFASDNVAGAMPEVMEALVAANAGTASGYGTDHVSAAAADRIRAYHLRQKPQDESWTDSVGATLGWRWTPVTAAGLYVPGGLASYPSSVLMNAIPAGVCCPCELNDNASSRKELFFCLGLLLCLLPFLPWLLCLSCRLFLLHVRRNDFFLHA